MNNEKQRDMVDARKQWHCGMETRRGRDEQGYYRIVSILLFVGYQSELSAVERLVLLRRTANKANCGN